MQIKIFNIPIMDDGYSTEELNKFLRSNKVLDVTQQLVHKEGVCVWSFCVRYLESKVIEQNIKRDYKQELDEETFKKFSLFREIRKSIATEDAVPPYAVFLDEELATLAKLKEISIGDLKKIKGIGEKKIEKYGQKLLDRIQLSIGK
jgi:superfamily II DNA helicase RecQ